MLHLNQKVMKSFALLTAVFASACGKRIPSEYRGQFRDHNAQMSLLLESTQGTLTTSEGRVIAAETKPTDIQELAQGRSGLYMRELSNNSNVIEIFWVNPLASSRQVTDHYVFMTSELFYTHMNKDPSARVNRLAARYCTNGQINIDLQTQTFNGGCPAESTLLDFIRTP